MATVDPFLSASELARAIRAGTLSAREVLDAQLARIAAHNRELNAIVTLDAERARARARELDEAQARGVPCGPLHGVPFTVKDAFSTAGLRTTVGFPPLAEYVPEHDATVVTRLIDAGAVLLGKTNVPSLLMRAQTDNPIFGRTNNPWEHSRTAGGSSGGSACAVAAALSAFDIGSDMSGSIRIPASYCGVFGFKPTSNRVPSTGHLPPLPGSPRVDRVMPCYGPLARSVEDLALITSLLVGPDGLDVEIAPVPWRTVEPRHPSTLKLAYLPRFPGVPTSVEVCDVVERVVRELARAGARVELHDPGFEMGALNQVWRAGLALLMPALQALNGQGEPPALSLIDWLRVQDGRDALIRATEATLQGFDAFLSPACISAAPPHSPSGTPIVFDGEAVESRFVDHYLYPFSFMGQPAVVLPAGLSSEGLPLGIQLVARRHADEELLAVAAAVSDVLGGFRAPPGLL